MGVEVSLITTLALLSEVVRPASAYTVICRLSGPSLRASATTLLLIVALPSAPIVTEPLRLAGLKSVSVMPVPLKVQYTVLPAATLLVLSLTVRVLPSSTLAGAVRL